ncbi:cytochrome c oxidase subunit II [Halospeciosus flavus]|uniref:cytochrome-c oxidase n=1 Tax=Halospeciosus flavus TaxID=3032283 RepID=A0ABD5Z418_9EURY|nr:cytochrome c oxidase subunit II [Halospeciosus flavus]
MRGKRYALFFSALAAFLVAGVSPAAAEPLSNTARYIDNVSNLLLAAALPITLLVEGILAYVVWKFRKTEEAKPTKENRRLEITWTVATAVVLLFVGVAAYGAMAQPSVTATQTTYQNAVDDGAVQVDIIGVQWYWKAEYPEHNISYTANMQDKPIVVPAERQLAIMTTATDVIHAVHIPALKLKKDSIPGQKNYIVTTINSEAIRDDPYVLYCAEFCGAGHSNMLAGFKVVSQQEYQNWVEQQTSSGSGSGASSGSSGTANNSSASVAAPSAGQLAA